jgi:membrane protease subunit (stomatin/prohibitin family)
MGVFGFVSSGLKAVTAPIADETRGMAIRRPDEVAGLVVYKWPNQNINWGSQLNVREDECAVFFRDNAVAGVLGLRGEPQNPSMFASPGGRVYQLETRNIPFLGKIVNHFSGGNIFTAEVFYVKTSPIQKLGCGGRTDEIEDPELGISGALQINCMFALEIADPALFITKYYGQHARSGSEAANNDAIFEWLRRIFFTAVKLTVSDYVAQNVVSLRNIGVHTSKIFDQIRENRSDLANYGCRMLEVVEPQMKLAPEYIEQFNEANKELSAAKRAEAIAKKLAAAQQVTDEQSLGMKVRHAQELGTNPNFSNYARGQALLNVSTQEGAGASMAGLGAQMAMGVGMANMMGQQPYGAQPGYPQPGYPQPGYPQAQPYGQPQQPAPQGGSVSCSKCNAQVPMGKFCQECGGPLAAAPVRKFCTGCGSELTGAKFCANCGTPVTPAGGPPSSGG